MFKMRKLFKLYSLTPFPNKIQVLYYGASRDRGQDLTALESRAVLHKFVIPLYTYIYLHGLFFILSLSRVYRYFMGVVRGLNVAKRALRLRHKEQAGNKTRFPR